MFDDAKVTLPDRDGRTFTITADEAELKPQSGRRPIADGHRRGNVVLTTSDGLR